MSGGEVRECMGDDFDHRRADVDAWPAEAGVPQWWAESGVAARFVGTRASPSPRDKAGARVADDA